MPGALPGSTLAKALHGNTERGKTRDDLSEINLTCWWVVSLKLWPPDTQPSSQLREVMCGHMTLSMSADLIFERWECVRKWAWKRKRFQEAAFWTSQSLFPGTNQSGLCGQEKKPGGFSYSSDTTVLPAFSFFRKGCLASSPSLLNLTSASWHTHTLFIPHRAFTSSRCFV